MTASRAEPYADRLLRQRGPWDTMGHLLHMPSHIYQRIGRYHDGVLANLLAFEADKLDNDNCRVPYTIGARVPHDDSVTGSPSHWPSSSVRMTLRGLRDLFLCVFSSALCQGYSRIRNTF